MSGLAIFAMKYPSLLQFDRDSRGDGTVGANLRSLYGVARAPSDTALGERLDEVDPRVLRRAFTRLFHVLQRGRGLEGFATLDGHYLFSVHGTGTFSSSRVHCASCCEKQLSIASPAAGRAGLGATDCRRVSGNCWHSAGRLVL